MTKLPLDGLCVVGKFCEVEQVRYGRNHDTKPGEPVPWLYQLILTTEMPSGEERRWRLSFSETDFDTGEKTSIAAALDRGGFEPGAAVMVRVATRASGKYVNLDAVRIAALGGGEPSAAAAK
jgi:hypothetical protein